MLMFRQKTESHSVVAYRTENMSKKNLRKDIIII